MRLKSVAATLTAATLFVACQTALTPTASPTLSFGPAPTATASTTAVRSALPMPDLEPAGPTEAATVVRVADGDTITVDLDGTQFDVRYIGIDSPEKAGPFTTPERLGQEATQANELLVGDQTVHLERDVSNTDRFDRLLRYVWLVTADGWLMANREIVRQGLAEARTYEPDTKWQAVLDAAELDARADGLGLWTEPAPPLPTPVRFVGESCDPAYPDACIPPPPPDLDCGDITYRRFTVLPPDPHNFDGDLNGLGCEAP